MSYVLTERTYLDKDGKATTDPFYGVELLGAKGYTLLDADADRYGLTGAPEEEDDAPIWDEDGNILEGFPYYQLLIDAGLETIDAIIDHDELSSLKGIGPKSKSTILEAAEGWENS